MFCPQCGNNIIAGVKFCGGCGWTVPAAAVPEGNRCVSCGTPLKEGAKFCPNCGGAAAPAPVAAPVAPAAAPVATETPAAASALKKSTAVDKAVFYNLGSQVYACYLYKDGVVMGNMTDTRGAFIPDVKEWLETRYKNIVIETIG